MSFSQVFNSISFIVLQDLLNSLLKETLASTHYFKVKATEDLTVIYVRECFAYVVL